MSLHSNDGGGGGLGGLFVLLPWWLALPLLIGTCVYADYQEGEIERQIPAWSVVAEEQAAKWSAHAYEGAEVLHCRHDSGSIFHCNAATTAGVIAFDCDGANPGVCELCSD